MTDKTEPHDPSPAWWQEMVATALADEPGRDSAAPPAPGVPVIPPPPSVPPKVPAPAPKGPVAAPTVPPGPVATARGAAEPSAPRRPTAPSMPVVPVPLDGAWWSKAQAAVWTPERLAATDAAQFRTAEAVERIGLYVSETPEERRRRRRAEDDVLREALGETPRERVRRHRTEDRQHQRAAARAASRPWRLNPSERARRFRRWCTLTALSASAGYAVGLVQWANGLPLPVCALAWGAAWALDLRIRGWGSTPVSQIRGPGRMAVLVLARVPVSSTLAALCGLAPLLATTGHLIHRP